MKKYWIFLLSFLLLPSVRATPVEIVFWHSMAGKLGQEITQLARDFNHSQSEYVVKPVYKGDYLETLTSFAAAFRAKQPPSIVQIFEVGTEAMLTPQGIIKPVDELMDEQGLLLPKGSFFPAVLAQYSQQGRLMAMPFNISVPVLFYNADALDKLGYTAETFPKTWDELEVLAQRLRNAGFPCAYATAYPAWIFMESFSALHGLPLLDSKQAKAFYNNKPLVTHLQRLSRWQQLHYFEYAGRTDESTTLFTSGRCPLFSQSAGVYSSLAALVPFHLGMAALPFDQRVSSERFNNVVGGAAIWVVAGQSSVVYRGIAQFFTYLAQPIVQQQWHQRTGYLPLGVSGIYEVLAQSSTHPVIKLAQRDLFSHQTIVSYSQSRMHNRLRHINEEELEALFAGIKNAQQAMDEAVRRSEYALLRFQRNTGSELVNKRSRN